MLGNAGGVKQIRFRERPFLLPLIQGRKIGEERYEVRMIASQPLFRKIERLPQVGPRLLIVPVLNVERAQVAEDDDNVRVIRFELLQQTQYSIEYRLGSL